MSAVLALLPNATGKYRTEENAIHKNVREVRIPMQNYDGGVLGSIAKSLAYQMDHWSRHRMCD